MPDLETHFGAKSPRSCHRQLRFAARMSRYNIHQVLAARRFDSFPAIALRLKLQTQLLLDMPGKNHSIPLL
eukprot:2097916-Amphidinium_carterae.1